MNSRLKYAWKKKEELVLMEAPSVWVVLLATVSVKGLIDVCQPRLRAASRGKLPVQTGPHSSGISMAAAQSDSERVCFPPQQPALPRRAPTDCLGYTELRSEVCASGKLSLSAGRALRCEPASRYLQRKNEAANY